jgi:cold shock CspA family protein
MSLTGTVSRWFNRKGYGFIKVLTPDSEYVNTDIFVHLSAIKRNQDIFYTLYPGEYISFDVEKENDKTKCVNVTGVLGGPLLVEHEKFKFKYFNKYPLENTREKDESQDQEEQ